MVYEIVYISAVYETQGLAQYLLDVDLQQFLLKLASGPRLVFKSSSDIRINHHFSDRIRLSYVRVIM